MSEKKLAKKLNESLESTEEIVENLNKASMNHYRTCEYSKIPEGRNWCGFYNQILAGRCPSCKEYKLGGSN